MIGYFYNKAYFGLFASVLGVATFVPIIYNVITTGKTNNFLWSAIIMGLLASIFWLLEGMRVDSSYLIANSYIFIFFYFLIGFVKYLNRRII